jgi:hypothetical protein
MLFELSQYRTQPGKRNEWVQLMEEEIIPYQIARGMVVVGSFTCPEEEDLYIWIRRFQDEEDRQRLYKATYETEHWKNDLSPRIGDLLDRSQTKVTLMESTPRSVIQ